MALYGKRSISGVHQDEVQPVTNKYNKDRNVYFEDNKKFLFQEEAQMDDQDDLLLDQQTLNIKLPKPKTLIDIVDFGIAN